MHGERIQLFEGSQTDTRFLTEVATSCAPDGFDIIMDDASHMGELTKKAFWHLFDDHLKAGGIYIIEDWGTGYWDDWPDGKAYRPPDIQDREGKFYCHSYGMVGFIKELVDEQGASDLTRARQDSKLKRGSKFESLLIAPSIVFVRKAW